MEKKYTLEDLVSILETLRSENGCPWDRVQTHETLKASLLEEAYEAVDAIDNADAENLCEELGDVLMQVVFHAQIEAEKGEAAAFRLEDIISGICHKMITRHPHVFGNGDVTATTPEEVLVNWEALKQKEKNTQTQTEAMKRVPAALPALMRAAKVQKKAAEVGFDFPNALDALQKVYEEVEELEAAIRAQDGTEEEEFGDILFALVNTSRFLKINPEFSLTNATKKFINRFEYIEKSALFHGKQLSELTLEEMDLLWDEGKKALRATTK